MKVLFATPEAYPYVKTGGLADVAGSLPKALARTDVEMEVILPLYGCIAQEYREEMSFLFYTFIDLSWRHQYCGVFRLVKDHVTYYFLDNEYYFKRDSVYGHFDDGERFAFFSKAVYTLLPRLSETPPDVVHCNDWQTALIPTYIREDPDPIYQGIRTVFTIHNIEYQGRYGIETLEDVFGLSRHLYDNGILRYKNDVSLMKGAIYTADYVTTVSPSYAEELKGPWHSCGLHDVIRANSHKLQGILNGIDNRVHSPSLDKNLYKKYSKKNPTGKLGNKLELQRMLELKEDGDIPVIVSISRLVEHKGFDLILSVIDEIMQEDLQFVILGTGDWPYEQGLIEAAHRYPGKLSVNIMYSDALSSKLYGGGDMVLIPSRSEPCGLSQMIAMRYGTVPIVRETGGLKDTVSPYRSEHSTGFTFANYSASDMLYVIREAIRLYREDKEEWKNLEFRCMDTDFSWKNSALAYIEIYSGITSW